MNIGYLKDYGRLVGNSRIDGCPMYKIYDKVYKIDRYGEVLPASEYDSSVTVTLKKKPYSDLDLLLLI